MNKVASRCQKEANAKFYYASRRMIKETKVIKLTAYFVSFLPIILSFIPIPGDKQSLVFAATMFSFSLSILLEFTASFLNNHKEKSILLSQLYEAEITGSTFSKIEYDREMTNDLHELAIRKSSYKMAGLNEYHKENVPDEIEDKYSYLYLCRIKAASTNYLMSRMYAIYIAILAFLIILFVSFSFVKNDTFQFLQLIIQFYPLVLPIIRNITASRKTMKNCTKLSADIDNFFADGDDSPARQSRFIYYAQNIEFEMLIASPARYSIFYKIFNKGLITLETGVTKRFIMAMRELQKETGKISAREYNKEIVLNIENSYVEQKKVVRKKETKPKKVDKPKQSKPTKTQSASKPKTKSAEKDSAQKADNQKIAATKVEQKKTAKKPQNKKEETPKKATSKKTK